MAEQKGINALGREAAYQLANVTKTAPQFAAITPRWISRFLDYKGLESGDLSGQTRSWRAKRRSTHCAARTRTRVEIPQGYIEYQTTPREYQLDSIATIINVDTKIADLYSSPYDQASEQIALAIESLRERQESQLINNDEYGLLKNIADSQRIQTRNGRPTPDDLDELLSKVWKEPSFLPGPSARDCRLSA
ncbi:35 kDa antigen [Raoultella terrigena]|uniref:35 kDa antigen n=1 Tax=Raoultella terrigena TaxID=577 RepID=A0A4U9D318_RAOTE|nr:35 kDa antigen [Raoultella terrigena]